MKTLALLGVAAIAIACDSPTSPRAPLKAPTTTSAAVLFNDRFETVVSVFDGCNGGFITLTAKFHDVFALTFNAAGGFHVKFHENFQGQGSNPVTGVNYVAIQEINSEFNLAAGSEATFTQHYNLIAKGNAPNEVLQIDFHITVTPNGDVTSSHNNFRLMCQGSDGVSPRGQAIAFASNRDGGSFQVFVMRPNGDQQTQLTFEPFYNARPNWSPDGRRITFTACRWYDPTCDIYVMNADGSAQTNLTNNSSNEQMSVWSPDGRKIAFVSDRDGNFEIYVMNADGSDQTRLTYNDAVDQLPSWSPDGRKIAFETTRDGNAEVYVMNANGSNPVNMTNNPLAADGFPAWSPRGDRIAFRSDRDGNGEIYVMDGDGRNPTRLTNNPAEEYYPAWSPTGNRIAFVSNRDGNFEIYVMWANGDLQTRVTHNPAFDSDPAWAIAKPGPE